MKTLIAVPCHEMVNIDFIRSFMDIRRTENVAYTFIAGTLIYEARNVIAANAVKNGFDRVLWLDADMIIPEDALERLSEDMATGIDFVSALYFKRKPPINPLICDEVYWRVKETGEVDVCARSFKDYPLDSFFEIQGAGFGCCMTSARLLKAVTEKYGAPFTPILGFGEDLAFCWRAAKIGFKMYCDSRIKCGHIGSYVFEEKDHERSETDIHNN